MTWYQQYRLEWILEAVRIYGFINRGHIERKFKVTTAIASRDIALVMKMFPGVLRYDKSAKHYARVQP